MKKIIGTAAAALALSIGGSASAVEIDLFDTPQAYLTDTTLMDGGLFSQIGPIGAGILGGYRDIGVELKMSPDPANRNASIGVSAGSLAFSTSSQAAGTGMIRWDGSKAATSFADADVDKTGLGGLSLGNPLITSFKLNIDFADAGFDFVITAWTDALNWSSINITSLAHPVPGMSLIPFMAFLDCDNMVPGPTTTCASDGMGGWKPVDFMNLGALQAVIDPNGTFKALDLTIDAVTTAVPEPGSLALAGLGLMGVAFSGTRRRRNAG
ncbi:MAG: PEP-CTERM motif protein [Candidatus Accumulibacter appositus]|uniref:PEP-CTERM motif protein n=1 Tax=Candidatus Accumulibacter appositus TaxID=1454003 RepID=A0A011PVK0_9PROT|nr:MAG: PEP-CTERM motif protein [Candidatus Accumulibacter appositus]